MPRLSAANLPSNVRTFGYDRDAVSIGVVHFGIGNFHRAHQAVYCEDLLESGALQWGIVGVSLRSAAMREALLPQDFLYTLATLGRTMSYRIIGAVKDVIVAPQNPLAVIDRIANPSTKLVSSTITEKGYYLASGTIDLEHPDLLAELASLEDPKTIYGYLARGIMKRRQLEGPPEKLTILCCDNISGGGEHLERGVRHLLQKHDPKALEWSQQNVGFLSSMVDRVCPATDEALKNQVNDETAHNDAWPVSAEPFSQWVIEDNFAGERPDFERVGANFVNDLVPFERMKLRLLNAAHSIISTIGYLFGDTNVHESIARPEIFNFVRQALYENILPNVAVPAGQDGAAYIEAALDRFQNPNLPYANLQVGSDTSQKISQRWLPTIDQAVSNNADTSYFQFCLAAWVIYIKSTLKADVLRDPKRQQFEQVSGDDIDTIVTAYLGLAGAAPFEFFNSEGFMSEVNEHARHIQDEGIEKALAQFLKIQTRNGNSDA